MRRLLFRPTPLSFSNGTSFRTTLWCFPAPYFCSFFTLPWPRGLTDEVLTPQTVNRSQKCFGDWLPNSPGAGLRTSVMNDGCRLQSQMFADGNQQMNLHSSRTPVCTGSVGGWLVSAHTPQKQRKAAAINRIQTRVHTHTDTYTHLYSSLCQDHSPSVMAPCRECVQCLVAFLSE